MSKKEIAPFKKLILKFPSFYILAKNKTNIKNSIIDMRGYRSIKVDNLFDVDFYLENNDSVRLSGMDPLLHYMYHGFKEGKIPNPTFDGNYYLNTYDDVKNSNLNPLVHYSLYGKKEGRTFKFNSENYELVQYSNKQINNMMNALSVEKISIIIPIYNDFEDAKKCIESVLENTRIPHELILIDDCSTDKRIETLLNEMDKRPNVIIIKNLTNKGFIKSINMGIEKSRGDVVILSHTTEVTPRWLQKLAVIAYSNEKIGTVTPLSNFVELFSESEIDINGIQPLTPNEMAYLVEEASNNINIEITTENDFCMFIKRNTIHDVGLFGKENDFCMRAVNNGWKNIINDSVYVYQRKITSSQKRYSKKIFGLSTSSSQLKRIQKNVKGLKNLDLGLGDKKRILYILHEEIQVNSGGVGHTINDLLENINETFECYILTATSTELTLWKKEKKIEKLKSWEITPKWSAKEFYRPEFKNIYFNILTGLSIDIVHIQHLYKHTFDLPKVAKILGLPIILSFHDFYYICPSINLLDDNNMYCAAKCSPSTGQCQIPYAELMDMPLLKDFIDTWRNEVSKIFDICSAFTAPTEVTMNFYTSIYSQLNNKPHKVIEHGRDLEKTNVNFELPSDSKPIKILVPGNIFNHKGSEFIKKLNEKDSKNRLEFHFMGIISPDLKDEGIYHGTYKREDFYKIVNKIEPSFIGIFSICPETYCHTLSEAWACGIPVLATKIGALEERVTKNGGGWLLEYESPSKSYNEIIRIASSTKEYLSVHQEASNIRLKSKKEMAYDYECIYWQNLITSDIPSNIQDSMKSMQKESEENISKISD